MLQWLDSSNGKQKINRSRGVALVPKFKFINDPNNVQALSAFFR